MQEELGWTRSSLRKCIRPLVENRLRAHDDDPRVPVLVIATVMKDPCYAAGSRARHLTVFSSFLFLCRLLRANFKVTSSSWLSQRLAWGDSFLRSTTPPN